MQPLPDDVREVQKKRYGRRYLYERDQILLREEEIAQFPQLADLVSGLGATPTPPPEAPVGDRPQLLGEQYTLTDLTDSRAVFRAHQARLALDRSGIAAFTLPKRPFASIDDVPAVVERVRAAGVAAKQNWHCWPHIVLAGADGSGTWGPGGPVTPVKGPLPPPKGTAGAGITVAVVDTGCFHDHHWLTDNLADVRGVLDDEVIDEDGDGFVDHESGHGTFIAGVIRSMAPGANIIVRGTVHSNGLVKDAELAGVLFDLIDIDMQIDVLNLSVGAYTHDAGQGGLPSTSVALRQLRKKYPRLTVVAAAGNDNRSELFFPAGNSDVIGVGALDQDGRKAPFSNFGPWVDTWALGVDVLSAWVGEDPKKLDGGGAGVEMARWSGTSFAAPRVAGAIAAAMGR